MDYLKQLYFKGIWKIHTYIFNLKNYKNSLSGVRVNGEKRFFCKALMS